MNDDWIQEWSDEWQKVTADLRRHKHLDRIMLVPNEVTSAKQEIRLKRERLIRLAIFSKFDTIDDFADWIGFTGEEARMKVGGLEPWSPPEVFVVSKMLGIDDAFRGMYFQIGETA